MSDDRGRKRQSREGEGERRESKRGPMHAARMREREKMLGGPAKRLDLDQLRSMREAANAAAEAEAEDPAASEAKKNRKSIILGSEEKPFTAAAETVAKVYWISSGLRVRIVDESGDFQKSYLRKGIVQRVSSKGDAADVELEGDKVLLKAVPQDLLETVVSKGCTKVEIVRGPNLGLVVELLQRDPKKNKAVVSMVRKANEGRVEAELPLDYICEFFGASYDLATPSSKIAQD